ncbi:MAG: bifunctional hydroxymethylpyrimidine kinase/phosphomethylpyrimidine kinase, partial [Candidatus Gastranaerophilales bacterium]|nr:bifunctional hydroxymethylpyrimidine kinase/phosphomethylpyrimidine kinase [Candidatus Gastranaerophilales bacterium]
MGWITLSLRRSQLQTSVNDLSFELLQLNQQRTRLSNFSSAIASNLAKGYDLETAIQRAKDYISGALASMLDLGT